MRTVVTFCSAAFNPTQPRPYFINPGCFGDDRARWLIGELRHQGLETDEKPDQEDSVGTLILKMRALAAPSLSGSDHPRSMNLRMGQGSDGLNEAVDS